ncbi:MAG: membrane protein insertase YidC, partial [Flavobacteriaceae bacterium]
MEEKKFDPYQFIGFILIALIMTWMLMNQQPVEEGTDAVTTTETQAETAQEVAVVKNDSIKRIQLQNNFGSFADLVQEQEASEITLENEVLSFVFSNKGGQIIKARLKGYT